MSITLLLLLLVVLILISAFFSSAETGMMSLNRYKLRHLARQKHKNAKRAQDLLKRPDRLLGVILLGNTFANIMASAIATIIATQLWGEWGVFVATLVLTIVILLFAEIIPKTTAAICPEKVAFFAAWPLQLLLKTISPLVWLLSVVANFLLGLFGLKVNEKTAEALTKDELRTVVDSSAQKMSVHHRHMLLGVLDLEKATLADVIIPRHRMMAINLDDGWDDVLQQIIDSPYSKLPVYRDQIDNVLGVLELRQALILIHQPHASIHTLEKLVTPSYFVPETTSLQQQLRYFQKSQTHFGFVVDEYGDLQGMVTLSDIVEEIVGAFVNDQPSNSYTVYPQKDGSHLVSGAMTIRDLNRALNLSLPTEGPKTLSGLITEQLQSIPLPKTALLINNYPIEIMVVEDNAVKKARIKPQLS